MANLSSNLTALLGRLLKALMVALVLPVPIGLLIGIVDQLGLASLSGATFREWVSWGFMMYVGFHILLYRPVSLFQVSHRVFSALARWLFGGQVSTVEGAGGGAKPAKSGRGSKGAKGDPGAQGSTLVAFSPYVIPIYTVLVCGLGWLAGRWVDRVFVDGPTSLFIGITIAFHWLMAADDLQQQRERWHIETYLLALGLIFLLTLLIAGACLPWALPEFSFIRALGEGLTHAKTIYTTVIRHLFF